MNQSDWDQYKAVMHELAATHNREMTDGLRDAYWKSLKTYPIEIVKAAIEHFTANGRKFPLPADIRELIKGGPSAELAVVAWQDVIRATSKGSWVHLDFEDRFINAAIRSLGGWPTFLARLKDAESEKWAMIDFKKHYITLRNRGVDGDICKPLPGLSEYGTHPETGKIDKSVPHRIACGNPAPCDQPLIAGAALTIPRVEFKEAW